MSEKRRGLGRGLGALIPTAPAVGAERTDRPSDVFFTRPPHSADVSPERADEQLPATPTARSAGTPTALDDEYAGISKGEQSVVASDAAQPSEPFGEQGGPVAETDQPGTGADDSPDSTELRPVPGAAFAELPVDRIAANPRQPRTVFDEDELAELVHSIKEIGVLQPIVVREVAGRDEGQPSYELIMGERRLRASREAGKDTIPAIIRSTADEDLLRDALLENLHRSQLNPLEEAAAYQQLLGDFGCTHDQLAAKIGRSRPQISNMVRLLKLPPLVQRRVAAGVLSAGHARALLGLSDGEAMERLAQRIVAEGLSVRTTEEIVALGGEQPAAARRASRARANHPEFDEVASALADRLDTRVNIAMGKSKGKLTVEFAGVDDLHRILETLGMRH